MANVCVIGLGYVGLNLAVAATSAGHKVLGLDVDSKKIKMLRDGISPVETVADESLDWALQSGFIPLSLEELIELPDSMVWIICVPTPLDSSQNPDLRAVVLAASFVAKRIRRGDSVVLESTTYPGTCREVVLPILEESGLRVSEEFLFGYSPERVDPANKDFNMENTTKIVAGFCEASLSTLSDFYLTFIPKIFPLSSIEEAEIAKLFENTFRLVNIALVNDLAVLTDRMGLSASRILSAAETKPYGFMKFTPGSGVGGHCIPIDPHYLNFTFEKILGLRSSLISTAHEKNAIMPKFVVDKLLRDFSRTGNRASKTRVVLLGVSYKANVSDLRGTPALEIVRHLKKKKIEVRFYDPLVPVFIVDGVNTTRLESLSDIKETDYVLLLQGHREILESLELISTDYLLDASGSISGTKGVNANWGKF